MEHRECPAPQKVLVIAGEHALRVGAAIDGKKNLHDSFPVESLERDALVVACAISKARPAVVLILATFTLPSEGPCMYQRILVPVDGSPTSTRGLDEAIRIAKLTGGRLRLFHVIDELSFALAMDAYAGYAGDWLKVLREKGQGILDEARTVAQASGVEADTVLCDQFSGSVHEQVTAEASKWPADLIVLGTHGRRGIGRFVMGSSAEYVLRYATVPVLLVRASERTAAVQAQAAGTSTKVNVPSAALSIE
jgi:nucleotide-binding universal stress UspA family protein